MNKYLQTIIIAPMTGSSKLYPTRVEVKHNKTKGWIVVNQIRTVDRQRITKVLGSLIDKEIEIKISYARDIREVKLLPTFRTIAETPHKKPCKKNFNRGFRFYKPPRWTSFISPAFPLRVNPGPKHPTYMLT